MANNARERGEFTRRVSEEVRAERARQRRTQKDIYTSAGLSSSTYVRLETAERVIDVEQLAKMAGALGLQASELLQRAETEPPEKRGELIEGRFAHLGGGEFAHDAAAHLSETSFIDEAIATEEQP